MERAPDKLAGREFRVSSFEFPVSSFEFRQTEPNKPKWLKTFPINKITRKGAKQTQRPYPNCYQLLTAILALISGKFGSKARGSLPGTRATPGGPAVQTNAGLKPAATGVGERNLPAKLRCTLESADRKMTVRSGIRVTRTRSGSLMRLWGDEEPGVRQAGFALNPQITRNGSRQLSAVSYQRAGAAAISRRSC